MFSIVFVLRKYLSVCELLVELGTTKQLRIWVVSKDLIFCVIAELYLYACFLPAPHDVLAKFAIYRIKEILNFFDIIQRKIPVLIVYK